MRRYFALGFVVAFLSAAQVLGQQAVPVASGGIYSTDLELRNASATPVAQEVGRLTFTHPGRDPQVLRLTVTLAPGETRWLDHASDDWDSGLWVLFLEPGIDAASYVNSTGRPSFEVPALRSMARVGDSLTFRRVKSNPQADFVAWPTVLNSGTVDARVEYVLTGPLGEAINDWFVIAKPGITQSVVLGYAPTGGTLRACLEVCGIGAGGARSPVYVFVALGPSSVGAVTVRTAE